MPLRDGDCIHGYGRYQCAVCYHAPGECDFGDCHEPAVCYAGYSREWRPMCAKHAAIVIRWDSSLSIRPLAEAVPTTTYPRESAIQLDMMDGCESGYCMV